MRLTCDWSSDVCSSDLGPLISWMYPVFGVRGACWFLGVSEWTFGALIFIGFWSKTAGVLGALGGIASFVSTTTIIPFMPDGWAASAGGFPAMTERVAFLMKDFVLLAVSLYLLKQDLLRLSIQYREISLSAATSTGIPTEDALRRVVSRCAYLHQISIWRDDLMKKLAGKVAL